MKSMMWGTGHCQSMRAPAQRKRESAQPKLKALYQLRLAGGPDIKKGSFEMRMKLFVVALLLMTAAGPAYSQNKDILRLEADMIMLQQQVKQLQASVDE